MISRNWITTICESWFSRLVFYSFCVKSVQIRGYFWSVFSCLQIEYRKIQTRNKFVFEHFSRSNSDDESYKGNIPEKKSSLNVAYHYLYHIILEPTVSIYREHLKLWNLFFQKLQAAFFCKIELLFTLVSRIKNHKNSR